MSKYIPTQLSMSIARAPKANTDKMAMLKYKIIMIEPSPGIKDVCSACCSYKVTELGKETDHVYKEE